MMSARVARLMAEAAAADLAWLARRRDHWLKSMQTEGQRASQRAELEAWRVAVVGAATDRARGRLQHYQDGFAR